MQIRKLKNFQIVEAICSDIVSEGLGISHIDTDEYKPLTGFILGVMPGESFLAKVTRVKSNHFHGVLLPRNEIPETWIGQKNSSQNLKHDKWAIFEVNKDRIEPECENFVLCGSCKLLQMKYERTIEFKKKWLTTQLQRSHVNFPDIQIIESPRRHHYRNHVQIHINKNKERGFYAPYSYTTKKFPPGGCLLFDQATVDKNFPAELELERCVRARIDYINNQTGIWSLYSQLDKTEKFTYEILFPENTKTRVTISNDSFFQTNTSIIPEWLKIFVRFLQFQDGPYRSLELFSGFGFISRMISLVTPIKSLGIDILPKNTLKQISIENNSITSDNFTDFFDNYIQHDLSILDKLKDADKIKIRDFKANVWIINPPRSGFLPAQIKFLTEILLPDYNGPIIYSSCNGATFARDAEVLQNTGYTIREIYLLDFFPYTSHYEVLACFEKKS